MVCPVERVANGLRKVFGPTENWVAKDSAIPMGDVLVMAVLRVVVACRRADGR